MMPGPSVCEDTTRTELADVPTTKTPSSATPSIGESERQACRQEVSLSVKFLRECQILPVVFTNYRTIYLAVEKPWTGYVKKLIVDSNSRGKIDYFFTYMHRFDIKDESDDVIFQLMQKDARDRKQEGLQNLVIGFHIMKV